MPGHIGVAGCGRMGQPMLAALRDAGFEARGFDLRPAAEYGKFAPAITNDSQDFAASLHTLITVVRDVAQTEDVLFGAQNFTVTAPNLRQIILCSTLSPRYTRALRGRIAATISLVDAPMSGAEIGARERRLSFMLGGDGGDLARLQPLFDAMGRHFHPMGAFGAGMAAKVLNNLLAASATAMTRLVLDWGDHAGLDETALLALIDSSSGQNWLASGFEQIEFARAGYQPENTIAILVKDVESALDDAPQQADTSLPRAVQSAIRNLHPRRPPTI